MTKATLKQLRFPTLDGLSVRASFDGGAMSSDFGAVLTAGVDRQIGLSDRLADAFADMRHESYITHPMRELLKQRIYQQAAAMKMVMTRMISVLIPCSSWL